MKNKHTLGATLLITGCCIGAGMIGLPVISATTGLIPSTLAMILCYFFATATGLLIVEATLWFDKRVNLISMANFALGKTGKWLAWSLFLFLFYCLFVAYIDGGGALFSQMLSFVFHHPVPREIGMLVCVGFVGAVVYAGTKAVSRLTRVFLLGLAGSYFALIFLSLPHVNTEQLLYTDWKVSFSTVPILLICFGYHNLVPTLTYYVEKNVRTLRFAIFIGNLLPFMIYFFWNFVILGILPETNSAAFAQIANHTEMVTDLLEKASKSQAVLFFAQAFSFFALLSPFMASTLAFVDFFKDGFKMPSKSKYEFLLYLLVLVPPTLLSFLYPHLFLKALGVAGGLIDVTLFGILPVLIVWVGRYVKKIEAPYAVAGGKWLLSGILIFSLTCILLKNFL